MILTDLSNAIRKLLEKISFHKHFNDLELTTFGTSHWKYVDEVKISESLTINEHFDQSYNQGPVV